MIGKGPTDLYDHLVSARMFTLIMNKTDIHMERQMATCAIQIC